MEEGELITRDTYDKIAGQWAAEHDTLDFREVPMSEKTIWLEFFVKVIK